MTDIAPAKQAPRYIKPPLELRITIGEHRKDVLDVIVQFSTGNHCFKRCGVRVHRDNLDSVPIDVVHGLQQWLLVFLEDEHRRQRTSRGLQQPSHLGSPTWPSVSDLPDPSVVVQHWRDRMRSAV